MSGRFDGRVAIVTGAASGIGRATVDVMRNDGADVVAVDMNEAGLKEVVKALGADHVMTSVTDVSSPEACDALAATVLRWRGRIDILGNVAGILDNMAPVHDTPFDLWKRVMAVNLDGPFNMTKACLPSLLVAPGGGRIVNIASIAGYTGGRAGVAYATSKHGVIGLTRSTAWMYADQGLRCNAVCPGGVSTNISENAPVGRSEAGMERLGLLLNTAVRSAEPVELANVVAFLASDAASFVNGAIVTADGGWTAG